MSDPTSESYSVKVAPGVVAAVIRRTALDVPGVVGLAEKPQLGCLLPTRQSKDGIHLDVRDGSASISLRLVVERESDMQHVGSRVQQAVAEAVATMLGMPVREVDVYVQDVR